MLGVVVALQIFLFDNLQLNLYVHPFIYLAFVLLLPMQTPGYLLLLLAAATGLTMDFLNGTPAVHTIATTAAAFCRPALLRLFAGKELITDGGIPNVRRIGTGKYFRYLLVFIVIHAGVFFAFEALTTVDIVQTLLRVGGSVACTMAVIWPVQRIFARDAK